MRITAGWTTGGMCWLSWGWRWRTVRAWIGAATGSGRPETLGISHFWLDAARGQTYIIGCDDPPGGQHLRFLKSTRSLGRVFISPRAR